jgi:hypothetical protein
MDVSMEYLNDQSSKVTTFAMQALAHLFPPGGSLTAGVEEQLSGRTNG